MLFFFFTNFTNYTMCAGVEDEDSVESESEGPEDVLPNLENLVRSVRVGRKRPRTGDDNLNLAQALVILGGEMKSAIQGMSTNFSDFHTKESERKREESEKSKRRKTDDELLEVEAVETEFEGLKLGDDCRAKINTSLRARLVGPFSDPVSWWSGDLNNDRAVAVVGDSIYYTHILVS